MKWKKASPGIRYREHPKRKWGVMPDRYLTIYYRVNGKLIQEALGWASEGWTLKKAKAELAALKENQRTGKGPLTLREKRKGREEERKRQEAEALTVSGFWQSDYLNVLKARIKRESSDREIREFTLRIGPAIGEKKLTEVVSLDIERILDRMRADGLSPRTQEYLKGTAFRIWKHAAKRKLVGPGENPASGIALARKDNSRLRVLTPGELLQILEELRGNPVDRDITLFCALTGCRFSEAARLTWEYVDIDRKIALFPETKNKDPRSAYLSQHLVEMLKVQGPGGPGERVFPNRQGEPYRQPPDAFRAAVARLGLNKGRDKRDRVSFHTLRHSAATIAARRGLGLKELQYLFGWKVPAMVFRYVKPEEGAGKKVFEDLAKTLIGVKQVPLLEAGDV